jgi:hypothetical protein
MKRALFFLLIVVVSMLNGFSQGKNVPAVMMIGIGAKNPTFEESNFKNFKFYYTPGLVNQITDEKDSKAAKGAVSAFGGKSMKAAYKGEPKLLEEMWAKKEMRFHALLYDKNGVACWEGYLDPNREITDIKGFEDNTLKDALKDYVDKAKVVEKEASGEIEIIDAGSLRRGKYYSYPLAERKIPAFNVVDVSGAEVAIKSITESGAPVLLIFFEIPSDIDLKAAKESSKPSLSQMLQSGGGKVTQGIEKIHNQLFGKK